MPAQPFLASNIYQDLKSIHRILKLFVCFQILERDDKLQIILDDMGQPMASPSIAEDISVELAIFSRWNKASGQLTFIFNTIMSCI